MTSGSSAADFSASMSEFRYCLIQLVVANMDETTGGRVNMALYAQTTGTQKTNSGTFVPIPGLSLTIPAGVDTTALAILNLPNPYAQGQRFSGRDAGYFDQRYRLSGPGDLHLQRSDAAKHRPHTDHPDHWRAAGKPAADRRGGVVRRARQHGHHRQSGVAERNPLARRQATVTTNPVATIKERPI
jgi:hypothetical protein